MDSVEMEEIQIWKYTMSQVQGTPTSQRDGQHKFKIGSPEKPLKTEQRDRESLSDRVTGYLKPSVQQCTPMLSQMPEVTYGRLCLSEQCVYPQ